MKIKQDPVTGLWCREDGAVLFPPTSKYSNFKRFRWTFGFVVGSGYRCVQYKRKRWLVHRIICCAFHGLPPAGKPYVDHINRIKDSNQPDNLHWVSPSENNANTDCVGRSIEKYGVRHVDDPKAYQKAYDKDYYAAHCEDKKAHEAAKRAEMRARGLAMRKGPDGKWGWHPRIRT